MRRLTPDEIRGRNRRLMAGYLLPYRLFLAGGTFILTLRKRGFCGAMKEARVMWNLQLR